MKKILIIDDYHAIRISLKWSLMDIFETVAFNNGRGALEFLNAHPKEIVAAFVDHDMPDMNGREVCTAIHALDSTISLIGFSGNETADFGPCVFKVIDKLSSESSEIEDVAIRAAAECERKRTSPRMDSRTVTNSKGQTND